MGSITTSRAAAIAATHFGITGDATELPGEVDSNYRITTANGAFVLKLSPPDTPASHLAARQFAMNRLATAGLAYQFPHSPTGAEDIVGLPDGTAATLVAWVEGESFASAGRPLAAAREIGRLAGSVVRGLEGFDHPALHEPNQWDLAAAPAVLRELGGHIRDPVDRALVEDVRDHLMIQLPKLRDLPKQVIHGDINDLNVLLLDGAVSGLIDFGDLTFSWRIAELAIAATYVMLGQDDPLSAAAEVVAGFAEVAHVSPVEADVIFDLIRARLAVSACVAASRAFEENEHNKFSEYDVWELLERLDYVDAVAAAAELATAAGRRAADAPSALGERRFDVLGGALSLSYESSPGGPLHIVRGQGIHLFDGRGRRYLDCVNNVAHVGHSQPDVTAAATDQMAVLNTNTRYLHDNVVSYAERLLETLPDRLEVVYLVNSGTEANELALRMARAATGRHNMAVLDHGYHGNTSAMVDLSPYKFNGPGGAGQPDWVVVLPLADPYRPDAHLTGYRHVVEELLDGTEPIAGLLAESIVGCGGQIVPLSADIQAIYDAVRARGGVTIADEVQTGLGRVGSHFWAFQLHDLEPDIVTMGKPIGNGHPLGAVAVSRGIAEAFDNGMEYFNTFGGNPVSTAVGLAVLDAIEQEELQANAADVGGYLIDELRSLMDEHDSIGDVRGCGLFLGVELVTDRTTKQPATDTTGQVVDAAKELGVLLSIDGPRHNVIKIKPPLVFNKDDADKLVATLDAALRAVAPPPPED